MCLAVPSKVVHKINDTMATVEVYGARKNVNLMLMPEPVAEGEYVLVHAGFAIQKVDESTASEALRLIQEMADLLEAEGQDPDEVCGYPRPGTFPSE
jgi:hydrogenase expression/formation protein HypC